MELYTLDGLLRRTEIVEGYESFVWAERYSDLGDIQIVAPSTQQNRNLLASGTLLGLSESRRVMKVETINDEDSEGSKKLKVTGSEISTILKDRVSAAETPGIKPGTWSMTDTPGNVIRNLFNYVCRGGVIDATDKLPLLASGSLYPAGSIPEDPTIYTIERPYGRLYDDMKEIADVWDLGFRMYKGDDDGNLYFDVYKGNDRTSSQQVRPAVIFSPDLDSLQNTSELTSVANSKNVAKAYNKHMTAIVYSGEASVTTSGFDKRTLFVDGSGVKNAEKDKGTLTADETTQMLADLTALGKQELAKNRSISAFDGEITQLSPYKYNSHYMLGDLVEMRNSAGLTNQMLVTEQIFAADETGEKAYPTLTMKLFITPGSWLAWENTQTWANAPGTWSTS
jgi:hypothetical protein